MVFSSNNFIADSKGTQPQFCSSLELLQLAISVNTCGTVAFVYGDLRMRKSLLKLFLFC